MENNFRNETIIIPAEMRDAINLLKLINVIENSPKKQNVTLKKPKNAVITDKIIASIKKVVYNDPIATIVYFTDGTKTVVKCSPEDEYNPALGFALAIIKKMCGNDEHYGRLLNEFVPWDEIALQKEARENKPIRQVFSDLLDDLADEFNTTSEEVRSVFEEVIENGADIFMIEVAISQALRGEYKNLDEFKLMLSTWPGSKRPKHEKKATENTSDNNECLDEISENIPDNVENNIDTSKIKMSVENYDDMAALERIQSYDEKCNQEGPNE